MLAVVFVCSVIAGGAGWLHPPVRKSRFVPPQKTQTPAVAINTFLRVCSACHGANGHGNQEIGAPSIASLPRWYLEEQLERFRSGWRGDHPEDLNGHKMRDAVKPLSDADVEEAIDIVAKLPPPVQVATLEGDAENGSWYFEVECMGCHRYNGHGEMTFHSGPIAGLQDWYLMAQLKKFRTGIRGYHADDEHGKKMQQISTGLSLEELTDVLAYVSTLSERYPLGKKRSRR